METQTKMVAIACREKKGPDDQPERSEPGLMLEFLDYIVGDSNQVGVGRYDADHYRGRWQPRGRVSSSALR
ncbi:MAG: hypothetical protein MZV70_03350 [Desulfobacterales bacterium]|nr:hypothetical protein [Desulfobacterales bacterium]